MTQVSPDLQSMQTENELICEKLLGWRMVCRSPDDHSAVWNSTYASQRTPSFTTWADAGLILEKLDCFDIYHTNQYWTLAISAPRPQGMGQTMPRPFEGHSEISGPLSIRAAALSYIRSTP
jgi:hypothetical protein